MATAVGTYKERPFNRHRSRRCLQFERNSGGKANVWASQFSPKPGLAIEFRPVNLLAPWLAGRTIPSGDQQG